MARGLRSSRAKTNKSKLRSKTFGPVEDARIDRLSKKLVEISNSTATTTEAMDVELAGQTAQSEQGQEDEANEDVMKADGQTSASAVAGSKKKMKTRKEARKIKRDCKRKPRNLIAFKTKARNPGAKRRRPPRI